MCIRDRPNSSFSVLITLDILFKPKLIKKVISEENKKGKICIRYDLLIMILKSVVIKKTENIGTNKNKEKYLTKTPVNFKD